MLFAHLADCHIGSWRDPKLRTVSLKAFSKAVDLCIARDVDFILIAGDLFNTSLPSVESLKQTVQKLKQLKEKKIPVYIIAGSHDFSPSGKTMLDVLEEAGLFINVAKAEIIDTKLKLKFTIDPKTGAKITGLLGKKGSLEKEYYENLIKENIEQEPGFKIFMFHSALTEFKPEKFKDIDSQPLSLLPKNFNYYAGGHLHYIFQKQEDNYGTIAYPGPLFPNNFKEIEDLETGGFYFVNVDDKEIILEYQSIQIHNIFKINIDCDNLTPEQAEAKIREQITGKEFNNTIVTVRLHGKLASGKPSDINLKEIFNLFYDKSAYFVMKNTNKLTSAEFEEIKIEHAPVEELENNLIKEHLQQIKVTDLSSEKEQELTKKLMHTLSTEKAEGETISIFENRIKSELKNILDLEL